MPSRHGAFPWRRLIELGLGVLALDAATFWGMTMAELHAICAARGGLTAPAFGRADLNALLARFPDARDGAG